eukprot:Pgem_evm1s18863
MVWNDLNNSATNAGQIYLQYYDAMKNLIEEIVRIEGKRIKKVNLQNLINQRWREGHKDLSCDELQKVIKNTILETENLKEKKSKDANKKSLISIMKRTENSSYHK